MVNTLVLRIYTDEHNNVMLGVEDQKVRITTIEFKDGLYCWGQVKHEKLAPVFDTVLHQLREKILTLGVDRKNANR